MSERQKNKNKYSNNYEKFLESGHFLVDPIKNMVLNHNRNLCEYFEFTQTISPKKYDLVNRGINDNGKGKPQRLLLGDMTPEQQHKFMEKTIRNEIGEDFCFIMSYEFQKGNGNLHTHGIIKHKSNYESHLRNLQKVLKKKIGRNSLSKLREPEVWVGYLIKELATTQIPLSYGNLEHVKNNEKGKTMEYFIRLMELQEPTGNIIVDLS